MCDFMSWLEDDNGKIYYLTDEIIADHFPDKDVWDCIGHSSISDYFGALIPRNSTHREALFRLPKEIAFLINEGRMNKMAAASDPSYACLQYDSDGYLISGFRNGEELKPYTCRGLNYDDYLAAFRTFWLSPDSAHLRRSYPEAETNLVTVIRAIQDKTYADYEADYFAREREKLGYATLRNLFDWVNATDFLDIEEDFFTYVYAILEPYGL